MLCHDVFSYMMFRVGMDIRAAEYAILVMKLQRLLFASLCIQPLRPACPTRT